MGKIRLNVTIEFDASELLRECGTFSATKRLASQLSTSRLKSFLREEISEVRLALDDYVQVTVEDVQIVSADCGQTHLEL